MNLPRMTCVALAVACASGAAAQGIPEKVYRVTPTILPKSAKNQWERSQPTVKLVKPCACFGQPVACDYEVTWSARSGTGGHVHNNNRPPGKVTTENGNSYGTIQPDPALTPPWQFYENAGLDAQFEFTLAPPEAGGIIDVHWRQYYQGLFVSYSYDQVIVEIPDLVRQTLPAPFWVETHEGPPAYVDHDNHGGYGAQPVWPMLQNLVRIYLQQRTFLLTQPNMPQPPPPPTLVKVSALSLPMGGLSDLKTATEWFPPHDNHRKGTHVDISLGLRAVPLTNVEKKALEYAVVHAGFVFSEPREGPSNPAIDHWHIRPR